MYKVCSTRSSAVTAPEWDTPEEDEARAYLQNH
jgi:hypothetical protein